MSCQGIMAECESPAELVATLRVLKDAGYSQLDAFTPYHVSEVASLVRPPKSPVPRWVLGGGLLGAGAAYLIQWWCAVLAYPLTVGGRPLHSAPAFIPITFETAILCAALSAFVSGLLSARLLRLYDPVFEVDGFERTSVDRFWAAAFVEKSGYHRLAEDHAALDARLEAAGARRVALFGGPQ